MGKVVPLSAGRKRGPQASGSAAQEAAARQGTPVSRRVARAMKNVALVSVRALWNGLVDLLLSLLLVLARPARLVFKLGIIGLLLVLVMEGMNHWRDRHLSMIAGGTIIILILALGFYESLINCLTIRRNKYW
ncbi:hypothetical protein AWB67_05271 [Caballeronia terrestris]|uniref:Uncharacterized protein n=1 Tax=Caballeronia terrestris TaxID=1226301 RepID=A0A158KBH7_9BURK|nr:hypothetical protein [Caballeronia terrestris]SAL78492.1 hypothetical protein AWB67_05271 [Caballeronia terrestris]